MTHETRSPVSDVAASSRATAEGADAGEAGEGGAAGTEAAVQPVPGAASDQSSATLLWRPEPGQSRSRPAYQIGRRIGAGGFAEVFEAELRRPPEPPQRVALKRLLPGLRADPLRQRQLRREAQIGAELRHENIARVLELVALGREGREGGEGGPAELAIAMELVEGMQANHLLHRLAQRGLRLRLPACGHVLRGLFAALAYLEHPGGASRPLVHADISLENLMLTREGGVKLIDFGVAAEERGPVAAREPSQSGLAVGSDSEDEILTSLHHVAGKRSYVPPEGPARAPSSATDLYAAGVCGWELLSGCRFPVLPAGAGARELGSLIAFAAEGLPQAGWLLLKSCLAADPSARLRGAQAGGELVARLGGAERTRGPAAAALGRLVAALMPTVIPPLAEGAITAETLLALPGAAELVEPLDFLASLLGRLHGAFCAHRVEAYAPQGADPSGLLAADGLPGAGDTSAPEFTLRTARGAALTPAARISAHELRDALDGGYVEAPGGALLYRVRPPGQLAHVVCLYPGPGSVYEPRARQLLRNLLCPTSG